MGSSGNSRSKTNESAYQAFLAKAQAEQVTSVFSHLTCGHLATTDLVLADIESAAATWGLFRSRPACCSSGS